MALKFRLRGLAETFVENITCRACGTFSNDDNLFATDLTKVTCEGIIVVCQCKSCGEIFVPSDQRLGVLSPSELRKAVEKEAADTGESPLFTLAAVRHSVDTMNAERKGELH